MRTARKRVSIMGVTVDALDIKSATSAILQAVTLFRADNSKPAIVCTPNAEIMMLSRKNHELSRALDDAYLTLVDGAGVVLAARILGLGRIPRAPGYDVSLSLLESGEPLRVFFLGGKPGVAETAAKNIQNRGSAALVVGCRDGYFGEREEDSVVDQINASKPDILFAALGAPKQELWMKKHRDRLRAPVCIGVGGTLDVLAGEAKLAPPAMRRLGLEWLYRLARQPHRAIRMLKLPQYILLAICYRALGRDNTR